MTTRRGHEASPPGASTPSPRDAPWKLVASWLVVGMPAAWGVAQVIVKSLTLFR